MHKTLKFINTTESEPKTRQNEIKEEKERTRQRERGAHNLSEGKCRDTFPCGMEQVRDLASTRDRIEYYIYK